MSVFMCALLKLFKVLVVHVVIGVVRCHHADVIPSVFLFLDFVVHFCTCSQTVFCDRQFLPVANYCTLLHRENGSFEVLCLQFCCTLDLSLHHELTYTYLHSKLRVLLERPLRQGCVPWPELR